MRHCSAVMSLWGVIQVRCDSNLVLLPLLFLLACIIYYLSKWDCLLSFARCTMYRGMNPLCKSVSCKTRGWEVGVGAQTSQICEGVRRAIISQSTVLWVTGCFLWERQASPSHPLSLSDKNRYWGQGRGDGTVQLSHYQWEKETDRKRKTDRCGEWSATGL